MFLHKWKFTFTSISVICTYHFRSTVHRMVFHECVYSYRNSLSEYAHHGCLAKAMEKTRDIGGYKYCDDLHLEVFEHLTRERLAADICIMGMLYESCAIISVNGLLYLYQCFYTSGNSPLHLFQSFALTTSVPLFIEWFFTIVSIAIKTPFGQAPVC